MIKIDWLYLRGPLIFFALTLILSIALALGAQLYEKEQLKNYEQSVSTLRSTFRSYKGIIEDIDLLEQYKNLYSGYRSTGLVGDERRLSWIESLESTNQVLKLPLLRYSLLPQEEFKRPGFKVKRGVEVNSSVMELSLSLLHEEDIFALFEGLRLSIKNLFTVDSCTVTRNAGIDTSLNTKKANFSSQCNIRWVTINAK
ncbi:MAG: hypothetical protein IIC58_12465 [Proteobacteria bacterium]|nr:hypothetical protein [Pseudomonadota bacterium]